MNDRKIYVEGIGEVLFHPNHRTRRINIAVKPFTGVIVSFPMRVHFSYALKIVQSKKSWILYHLNKIKELEKMQIVFDENSNYSTKHHKLILSKDDIKNISVNISENIINVVYPSRLNVHSTGVQKVIRKGIEQALSIEAKQYLPYRVKLLAEEFCFSFNKLSIKNMKSRWGSCSQKKNISLNIHLMRLPEHLIDYVILHELVHTIHLNHGTGFWKLLDRITGGAKKLDKELSKFRTSFF